MHGDLLPQVVCLECGMDTRPWRLSSSCGSLSILTISVRMGLSCPRSRAWSAAWARAPGVCGGVGAAGVPRDPRWCGLMWIRGASPRLRRRCVELSNKLAKSLAGQMCARSFIAMSRKGGPGSLGFPSGERAKCCGLAGCFSFTSIQYPDMVFVFFFFGGVAVATTSLTAPLTSDAARWRGGVTAAFCHLISAWLKAV